MGNANENFANAEGYVQLLQQHGQANGQQCVPPGPVLQDRRFIQVLFEGEHEAAARNLYKTLLMYVMTLRSEREGQTEHMLQMAQAFLGEFARFLESSCLTWCERHAVWRSLDAFRTRVKHPDATALFPVRWMERDNIPDWTGERDTRLKQLGNWYVIDDRSGPAGPQHTGRGEFAGPSS